MTEMHAGISESDASKGGSEATTLVSCLSGMSSKKYTQHLTSCFVIGIVFGDAREVLDCGPERPRGENVGDGVAPLVCWAQDWVGWTRGTFRVTRRDEQE